MRTLFTLLNPLKRVLTDTLIFLRSAKITSDFILNLLSRSIEKIERPSESNQTITTTRVNLMLFYPFHGYRRFRNVGLYLKVQKTIDLT